MFNQLASSNLNIYPPSLVVHNDVTFGIENTSAGRRLVMLASPEMNILDAFEGEHSIHDDQVLLIGPLSSQNAIALRNQLPWLRPRLLGLNTSAGMGDRIGLATPGHVRAVRATQKHVEPIFAQQSIREMNRTNRTPQQVMDDATWGIFMEGWQGGFGADADHLKLPADIDVCLAANFTLFTIDPGAHVDNRADTASLSELSEIVEMLPVHLQPSATGLAGKKIKLEHLTFHFDEMTLTKAVVKYGRAVAHVVAMYQYLQKNAGQKPNELEVSVDETELPTSHAEHYYFASELKRLGVQWVSLAPRFVGRFEKGVDYISPTGRVGESEPFEADIAGHAAIARNMGPYKLSLHSGSDKFSIYPAAMRQTHGLVHLKTAGTSYLEALRTIASLDTELFREIYLFARERYQVDKASYHVSAEIARAPLPEDVSDWPGLLDQFDAREILHVTFGSVLTEKNNQGQWRFYEQFMELLHSNPEVYAANLQAHFLRHLQPFTIENC